MMPLPAALAGSEWAKRLYQADAGIPYGIALAGAALIVYPQSEWMGRLAG
jgi:prepilin peptidase CpaA